MNRRSGSGISFFSMLWIIMVIAFLPMNCFAIDFFLVDVSANKDIDPLINNGSIDLSKYGSALNIRAKVNEVNQCNQVKFVLNSSDYRIINNIETREPYCLAGDYPAGQYKSWNSIKPGDYDLTARAYDSAGAVIDEKTIHFSVVSAGDDENKPSDDDLKRSHDNISTQDKESNKGITFTLVKAQIAIADAQAGDLYVLNNNSGVYLDDAAGKINVRAEIEPQSDISKFDFFYDGRKMSPQRTKPYSLFGDENGRYKSKTPSTGPHKIKGVAYSAAGNIVAERVINIYVYKNRNSANNDSANNDSANNDSADNDSADNDSVDNDSVDNDSADNDSVDNDSVDNDPADNDSTDNGSTGSGWPLPESAKIRNKNRDLISLHYDNSPDPDDVHSVAAAKTIMDQYGIQPHVVSGTYAKYRYVDHQNGVENYQPASERVMRAAWGDNWLNAHNNWDFAVSETAQKWKDVINGGGHVWIAEAGTSDFTAEVLKKLQQNRKSDGSPITQADTKNQIHLVQHGSRTGNLNEGWTLPENLAFVKANTDYTRIDNGNKGEGKGGDNRNNATADLQLNGDSLGNYQERTRNFVNRAKSHPEYGPIWNQAFIFYSPFQNTDNTANPVWNEEHNRYIEMHCLDFSDTVEVLFILGIGKDQVANPGDFADMFFN